MRAVLLAAALAFPAHTSAVVGGSGGVTLSHDAHTVYDIGSVAKTFTAVAVLDLAQRRRLRLSETLSSFFAGVPRAKRRITVAQLLTHTSGLAEYLGSDQVPLSRGEALRAIFALPLRAPGRFRYSDAGYTLLAAIVQRVAHEPFERYVRQRLFARAGLHETGFVGDAQLHGRPFAHGYVGGSDRGVAGTQAPLSWSILGAGGVLSTAADLYRWVRALQAGAVLAAHWRNLMWRAGYGWVVGPGLIAVGGGTDFGYTSDVRIYPARVTVVLSSTDAHPAPALARTLSPS